MTGYPGAIIYPADERNYRKLPNTPQGFVLHTPEEAVDDTESTPVYFSTFHPYNPATGTGGAASTHYYLDSDGDVYQMVDEKWSPIANGVNRKPYPSWANPNISLNGQSLNVEIEGRGASIHQTMPVGGVQFNALVKLIKHRCAHYGIPTDRTHIIGHYQVAFDRSDPGAKFPWDALIAALNAEEDDMITADYWTGKSYGPTKKGAKPWEINLYADFGPASAYLLSVTLDAPGHVIFMHGDFSMAGEVKGVAGTFTVIPGPFGTAAFECFGTPVKFRRIAASLIK